MLAGVVKRFGPITAVNGLDLDVSYGHVLGLLGPNGAGKSTTMRMLTGQTEPDEGTISVLGQPVPERSKQARARMGVVPQQDNLDTELTTRAEPRCVRGVVPRSRADGGAQRSTALSPSSA